MDIKFLTGDIYHDYPEKETALEAELPYAKQFIEANFKSKSPVITVDILLGEGTFFHYVARGERDALRFSSRDLAALALSLP